MNVKGLHEIATMHDILTRPWPVTRAQRISYLANLELKKEWLERRLEIWVSNQKRTERQLSRLRYRIKEVQRVLDLENQPQREEDQPRPAKSSKEPSLEY